MKIGIVTPRKKIEDSWQRTVSFNAVTLPYLASLIPEKHTVEILDDVYETFRFDPSVDVYVFSLISANSKRGYALSDLVREKGKISLMGGIHVSSVPEESLAHSDAIGIGEGEMILPEMIEDIENDSLRRIYSETAPQEFVKINPAFRKKMPKKETYIYSEPILATKGCNRGCSFCSSHAFFGKTRFREISDVVDEVKSIEGDFFNFIDDNVSIDRDYALELFARLKGTGKQWFTMMDQRRSSDETIVKAAYESGCKGISIGFETVNSKNLSDSNKNFNHPDEYKDTIELLHKYGMIVTGNFIFGFDNDDVDVFEKTLDVFNDASLDIASFHALTPFPNTKLFSQMRDEGRLSSIDWSLYDGHNVVFDPILMSNEDLKNGIGWLWGEFYSQDSIVKRESEKKYKNNMQRNIMSRINSSFNAGTERFRQNYKGLFVQNLY